jgi:rhodanese-related sulfurtransferase
MLKKIAAITSALLVSATVMFGGVFDVFKGYNYISAKETAELIRTNPQSIVLVDIQEKPGFAKEHLIGAIETNAYPVKKQDELDRLAALLPQIKPDQKVIIICPRGGGGADRAYDFYLKSGINKDNIFTLKNGQEGWPREQISDVLAK